MVQHREMVNINEVQFGFVADRGTTDAIFNVHHLQGKHIDVIKQLLCALFELKSIRSCAKKDLVVGSDEPRCVEMGGGACHLGHVIQCPESCANGQYNDKFGWSWFESGLWL